MNIRIEIITESFFNELQPLAEQHAVEVEFYNRKPSFNRVLWLNLQELGLLKMFTARTDENELIGYLLSVISPDFSWSDLIVATQTGLFVHPDYRGTRVAFNLISMFEDDAKQHGADYVAQGTTTMNDVSRLYEKLGYICVEKKFMRKVV